MLPREIHIESGTGRTRNFNGVSTYQDLQQYPRVDYIIYFNQYGEKMLLHALRVHETDRRVWKSMKIKRASPEIQSLYILLT